jgi:ParB family chromosome partitioning protein
MLPTRGSELLPWLLQQSDDVTSNLFAFCVAATLDSVSGTDRAHPVNALCNVLNLDMTKYRKATQASYLNHVSKDRISEVVTVAVSTDAAAPLALNKKQEAASMAERLLSETGWLPEVLVNREVPDDYSFASAETDEVDSDQDDPDEPNESNEHAGCELGEIRGEED